MKSQEPREKPAGKAEAPAPQPKRKSISMHEGVEVWEDCCSCEAEPYWAELANEQEEATEDKSGK